MPDYKKKKHIKSIKGKSKSEYADDSFEIEFNRKSKSEDDEKPRVIRGNKGRKTFKIKVLISVVALLSVVILLSFIIFPVGISETVSDFIASIGTGEYPVDISGSKVLNVCPNENYFYVLTDMNLYSVSNSGKRINSIAHGFSVPVIKISKTRVLVYDQGQKTFNVLNVHKSIFSETLKSDIICADISDCGAFAVATLSDSYSSTFSVYDKNNKSVFTWNCAKETISALSLSPNGKKIAVSTLFAINGELSSKIYIFDLNKTDAEKTFDYSNKTVYSLSSNSYGAFAVSGGNVDFISWKDGNRTENFSELQVDFFRKDASGAIAVLNRKNDRTDNTVVVLSKKGQKTKSFTFKGNISDIRKKGSHIYLISDDKVHIYNLDGTLVSSAECGYDRRFAVAIGSRSVNVVSDNEISQIYIK